MKVNLMRLAEVSPQRSLGEIKGCVFLLLFCFWDRERQSMNGGGAEREGDTESETGSRL